MKLSGTPVDILVVMDPITSISPKKDSSFAMMLGAQRRGWRIWYTELADIWLRDGQACGRLTELRVIDGEPNPYALVRFAPTGDHRANMSVGARSETRALNAAERRICDRIGPVLQEMGMLFVGIDVIGEHLTEINVTNPTGIRELDRAWEINVAGDLLTNMEAKI